VEDAKECRKALLLELESSSVHMFASQFFYAGFYNFYLFPSPDRLQRRHLLIIINKNMIIQTHQSDLLPFSDQILGLCK